MSEHVLVTGGAGFVGSNLSKSLLEKGYKVTIIDDLSNGKEKNLPLQLTQGNSNNCKFIKADLALESTYESIKHERFSKIFHIAAQSSNAISFRDPVRDLMSNQLATLRLLEYARQTGCQRFLFTSSMSVYGRPSTFPTPENERPFPDSQYAIHKYAAEHYCRVYEQEYGIKSTIFRLYTTYGSEQNLDNLDQGLLSIYLAYLVKGIPIVVKGDLNRKRDIVHVSDVIRAIQLCMNESSTHGKTFNLCTGTAYTIRELINELIKQMGKDPATYPIEVQGGTQGDPPTTFGSYQSIKNTIGFEPAISPFEGIKRTVEGLKKL